MKLLRVSEVAEQLDCSEPYVYKIIDKGELPAYRIAGIRVSQDDLDEFVASRRVATEPTKPVIEPAKHRRRSTKKAIRHSDGFYRRFDEFI